MRKREVPSVPPLPCRTAFSSGDKVVILSGDAKCLVGTVVAYWADISGEPQWAVDLPGARRIIRESYLALADPPL